MPSNCPFMFDETKPLKRPGLVHVMYVILESFLHFRGMHFKYNIISSISLANQSLSYVKGETVSFRFHSLSA